MEQKLTDKIIEVSCEEIELSPFQPRKKFSEAELAELADSIQSVGIIQPPIVRKIDEENRIKYQLIAGERRLRAAQLLGMKRIKVVLRCDNIEIAAQATLIENIQRVELNPIEMALGFKKLIEYFQMTQEELSEKIGKKRSTIANYLRLLCLPKEIQDEIALGKISFGHAKVLLSLDEMSHQIELKNLIIKKELTVRQTEEEALRLKKEQSQKMLKKDLNILHIEELLRNFFGSKVKILSTKKGHGKIVIDYFSLDDFDEILKKLNLTDSII